VAPLEGAAEADHPLPHLHRQKGAQTRLAELVAVGALGE
jgi:hypothetical protein